MDKCKILIGGDLCPTESNYSIFEEGKVELLFDKALKILKNNDLNIVNLECPLLVHKNPIRKVGPSLGANSNCINALKKAKINMVNLGNNHIMDHGISGIKSTINILKENKINYVGVGTNINIAKKMKIKKINNFKIGILSITETDFYNATLDNIGTAPIDIINIYQELSKKKNKCDYIITLIHGGVEHYPYPSPQNQRLSRFLIKNGVDCVVWQHSHCSGYIEKYAGKYIIYGQGNFIFDFGKMHPDWYKGYAIELELKKNKKVNVSFNIIPFIQSFNKPGIYVLEGKQKEMFINEIFSKTIELKNERNIEKRWNEFCNSQKEWYLTELVGYEHLLKKDKALHGEQNLSNRLFKKLGVDIETLIKLRNLIFCESHNEMIKTSIQLYIKGNKEIL